MLPLSRHRARLAWRQSGPHRNLRCMHDAPQDVLVDAYPEEEFRQDPPRSRVV